MRTSIRKCEERHMQARLQSVSASHTGRNVRFTTCNNQINRGALGHHFLRNARISRRHSKMSIRSSTHTDTVLTPLITLSLSQSSLRIRICHGGSIAVKICRHPAPSIASPLSSRSVSRTILSRAHACPYRYGPSSVCHFLPMTQPSVLSLATLCRSSMHHHGFYLHPPLMYHVPPSPASIR